MTLSPSVCCMCGENGESGSHLFIHCPFALSIWGYFLSTLSFSFVMSDSIQDVINQWGAGAKGTHWGMLTKTLLQGIIWVFGIRGTVGSFKIRKGAWGR